MPATIITGFESATPVAAADNPVNAFSSEITTGMSAPPIGNTTMLPRIAAATRMPRMKRAWECVPAQSTMALATHTANRTRLRTVWVMPGSFMGRPGRISWSFPNAMFDPQNEIEPTIAPKSSKISDRSAQVPPKWWRYSTHAISATAPPPTPLNSATICGIAVIRTLRAAGTPTAVPITIPRMISQTVLEPWNSPLRRSVAATAIAMPSAAILLPRTAVRGPVRPVIP
jgi:hypothetical protein